MDTVREICDNFVITNKKVYRLTESDENDPENMCSVYFNFTNRQNLLAPCGHTQLCQACIDSVRSDSNMCPICRTDIQSVIKIH